MRLTLREIAEISGGELRGDPLQSITGAAALPEATEGEITFFSDRRYLAMLRKTRASAVFVPVDFSEEISLAQIRVEHPANALQKIILEKFAPTPIKFEPGIHPTAIIAKTAKLGANVSVQPGAVIEDGVVIGDNSFVGAHSYIGHESTVGVDCLIYPRVTIRERSRIGNRVVLHSGAVIGADGFGFEMIGGRRQKIPQLGIVQLDDDVEIGANTTIDRARFGRTWLQEGAKIDNLVQIAHNVVIGKHTVVAAQTGIAGSARVGNNVALGGQVGVNGHIEIGDGNIVGGQTGVTRSLPANGGVWWDTPVIPLARAKQQYAFLHRLGKLFDRVKAIEKKLAP